MGTAGACLVAPASALRGGTALQARACLQARGGKASLPLLFPELQTSDPVQAYTSLDTRHNIRPTAPRPS